MFHVPALRKTIIDVTYGSYDGNPFLPSYTQVIMAFDVLLESLPLRKFYVDLHIPRWDPCYDNYREKQARKHVPTEFHLLVMDAIVEDRTNRRVPGSKYVKPMLRPVEEYYEKMEKGETGNDSGMED